MITLDFHPLTNAIVESWRRSLPQRSDGQPVNLTQEDLRDLIRRLCQAIELLAQSMDTAALLRRFSQMGDEPHSPSEQGRQ